MYDWAGFPFWYNNRDRAINFDFIANSLFSMFVSQRKKFAIAKHYSIFFCWLQLLPVVKILVHPALIHRRQYRKLFVISNHVWKWNHFPTVALFQGFRVMRLFLHSCNRQVLIELVLYFLLNRIHVALNLLFITYKESDTLFKHMAAFLQASPGPIHFCFLVFCINQTRIIVSKEQILMTLYALLFFHS